MSGEGTSFSSSIGFSKTSSCPAEGFLGDFGEVTDCIVLALLLPRGGDGASGSNRVKDFVESADGLDFIDPVDAFLDIVLAFDMLEYPARQRFSKVCPVVLQVEEMPKQTIQLMKQWYRGTRDPCVECACQSVICSGLFLLVHAS